MKKLFLVALTVMLACVILLPQVHALVWPTSGRVIGKYGDARNGGRKHKGTDIYNRRGTRIGASAAGRVAYASRGYNGGYGNVVYVSHSGGLQTRYAHLYQIYCRRGQHVYRNKTIGLMGNSATGNVHLHFEILKYGVKKPIYVRRYSWVTRGRHISGW